ncbi:MAG: amidohydrolase family protein [Lachnospiraceae bacterium]|nr:amidohydrolase family protein [Lachnospiraceae bacterium]
MRMIDTHVHIFPKLQGFHGKGELVPIGNGKGRWATGEVVNMIPSELGTDSFTMDSCHEFLQKNGVDKAVLLQGNFYGFQNEYIAEAVKKYPDMFVGAGIFDPLSPYADMIYERLTKELNYKVLKFECSSGCGLMTYHHPFALDQVFDHVVSNCRKNGQVIALDIGSPGMASFQPEAVSRLADTYPEVKIVVCHLLAPSTKDEAILEQSLKVLKKNNIYFDLAALPFNVKPDVYPYPTALRYIKMAKDIVGADHLMWGTDLPSVMCYDTYTHLKDFLEQCPGFSQEELESVYYKTALEVYPFDERKA